MTGWLRRAGFATLPDGGSISWTVAEGRSGRRWRWRNVGRAGELRAAGLLELRPTGEIARLELATAAGLLTVHPEAEDGRLHGNVVAPGGVRAISLDWRPGDRISVEGSVVMPGALGRASGPSAAGEGRRQVAIGLDLRLAIVPDAALAADADLDGDGIPRLLAERSWPLE